MFNFNLSTSSREKDENGDSMDFLIGIWSEVVSLLRHWTILNDDIKYVVIIRQQVKIFILFELH